jgi:hypothetical protein
MAAERWLATYARRSIDVPSARVPGRLFALLLGYGSDRWWRVQVIAMFAATAAIVAVGAYHYVGAPVRIEISVLDAGVSPRVGPSFELSTDLALSNDGVRPIAVSQVSLCLAWHNPPRCYTITGHSEEASDRGTFRVPAGRREHRRFRFPSSHESLLKGLDIAEEGSFIVEASLSVRVVDALAGVRQIPVEGLTAVVRDGVLLEVISGDVVARYVGT